MYENNQNIDCKIFRAFAISQKIKNRKIIKQ